MSYKLPFSVLVVIVDKKGDQFLLLERAKFPGYWQSVTGSIDQANENYLDAAIREVQEETGISVGAIGTLHNMPSIVAVPTIVDLNRTARYAIMQEWRHRYAPDVDHNEEHWFMLLCPSKLEVTLSEYEHTCYNWFSGDEAKQLCFSPSNREAIAFVQEALK